MGLKLFLLFLLITSQSVFAESREATLETATQELMSQLRNQKNTEGLQRNTERALSALSDFRASDMRSPEARKAVYTGYLTLKDSWVFFREKYPETVTYLGRPMDRVFAALEIWNEKASFEPTDKSITCGQTPKGFLPQKQDGSFIGTPTDGFQNRESCLDAVNGNYEGLICSIESTSNRRGIVPHRIQDGFSIRLRPPGAVFGFEYLEYCNDSIRSQKNGLVCSVGSTISGLKNGYKVFAVEDGRALGRMDAYFTSLQNCNRAAQGSSASLVCVYNGWDAYEAVRHSDGLILVWDEQTIESCNKRVHRE